MAAESRREPPALAKLLDRLRWKRSCCGRRRPVDDSSGSSSCSSESRVVVETTRPRRHTCEVLPQEAEPAPVASSSLEDEDAGPVATPEGQDDRPKTNEYQLRVHRCLQCLHLPDWYVEYARRNAGSKGFLLNRDQTSSSSHLRWPGLTRNHVVVGKAPARSVSDTGAMEMKKMSKLSAATVIFRYRPPYLGWRSQERLMTPRTPAERLASGFKSRKEHSVFNRCYKCKTCNRLNHKGRHIFY